MVDIIVSVSPRTNGCPEKPGAAHFHLNGLDVENLRAGCLWQLIYVVVLSFDLDVGYGRILLRKG
jgi:hypothetical protein